MDEQNMPQGSQPVQPTPNPAPQPANPDPAPHKSGQNTGMAVVAYILFFVPLLTSAKNDPFVKFHVKQGLVLFILSVIVSAVGWIMPWYMWYRFSWILSLVIFVFFIIGVINAVNGKQEKLPLIGQFADMFKF
jgi:uncharacterized membrane protein